MVQCGDVIPPRRSATKHRSGAFAVFVALALVMAACSGNGRSSKASGPSGTTPSGATGPATPVVDTSTCTGDLTTGVSGNTITIGTSLPQSGIYSAFDSIRRGEQAFFSYTNANGGVTVAGK